MKQRLYIYLKFLVVCALAVAMQAGTFVSVSALSPEIPGLHGKNFLLANSTTGEFIYQMDIDEKIAPASLTKMMTAIVVLENVKSIDDIVTVSNIVDSIDTDATVEYLRPGETMSVRNLLYCLMLPSAADAADVLAEYVGGDVTNFVALMNRKAADIGMRSTHFANPDGLDNDGLYTTVRDLYTLVKYAMQNESLMEICGTNAYTVPATNVSRARNLTNTNKLLDPESQYYCPNTIGMKTGYTTNAGRCIASIGNYNDNKFICIVMGCEPKEGSLNVFYNYTDAAALLNFAYTNCTEQTVLPAGTIVGAAPLKYGKSVDYVPLILSRDVKCLAYDPANFKFSHSLSLMRSEFTAPMEAGTVLGQSSVYSNDTIIDIVDVTAKDTVEKGKFGYFLRRYIAVIITLALFFLFGAIYLLTHKRQKNKKGRNH